jgi:hypothetical protein
LQVPPEQLVPARQAFPHWPQFDASVWRSTQDCEPAQAVGAVAGHAHEPPTQTSFVSGQMCPHVPQFAGSVARATHEVEQASGVVPGQAHAPAEHVSFDSEQTFPHAPQFDGSADGSMQFPLQRMFGAGQTHTPP